MITKSIIKAKQALENDEAIGIPTETVYGLAANIYSETAVKKIFSLKGRPLFNPLIVHIKSIDQLNKVVANIPEVAIKLAKAFWPGPLTLILKKQKDIPGIVTAQKDTVAVRVPNHPISLRLLSELHFPLAAPSANPFGSISATTAEHVSNYFKDDLGVILDGGKCAKGIESTIIGFKKNQPIILRLGSITLEEIEKICGKVIVNNNNNKNPDAPGMMSRHYAPATDTYLTNKVSQLIKENNTKKIGLLLFSKKIKDKKIISQEVLSKKKDLKEAARKLYAALHRLDQKKLDIIIAERLPNYGLGKTINDRLERATRK